MSQAGPDCDDTRAVEELLALWRVGDPWHYDPDEIAPLQLQALSERFEQRRLQLKVLDERARAQQVDCVKALPDTIPLLFSHTTYKSYPESFIKNGRWDMMLRWLGTLSTRSTANADMTGVTDIDGWIQRLHAAGHLVIASSGTTGRSSFVNQTPEDFARRKLYVIKSFEAACGQKPEPIFPFFWAGPRSGWNAIAVEEKMTSDIFARPGDTYYISDQDISIAQLDRLAAIRKAIIDGTATPDLIADAEKGASERLATMEASIERFIDQVFAHRHEPILLCVAGASMLWRIVEGGRTRGIADGALHPESIIRFGGGLKGFKGPATFREDAERFFGIGRERWLGVYGMTELLMQIVQCTHGRYHCPPTTIPLILDKSGEQLLNQRAGVVEGRGGFFDLALQGRWGGVITGDHLKFDFSPCPCGRKSPSVIEITRYKDLPGGDDKLTCAGQIDTYVRGFTGGDWQQ